MSGPGEHALDGTGEPALQREGDDCTHCLSALGKQSVLVNGSPYHEPCATFASEKEPIFWTCDDSAETLSDTDMDEAIESHLDGFWPAAWEHKHPDGRLDHAGRIAAFLAALPAEMEAYGYTRAVVPPNLVMDADDLIEEWTRRLEEDEWGDPDGRDAGDAFKDFDAVKAAARNFVKVAHENYTPWSCEITTTVKFNPVAWITVHHPEWLDPKAP